MKTVYIHNTVEMAENIVAYSRFLFMAMAKLNYLDRF